MRIIFGIGHPAHIHLFKSIIQKLSPTNEIKVVVSNKDILENLLIENNIDYTLIANPQKSETLFDKALKIFNSSKKLFQIVNEFKPDLLIGCLTQIALVSAIKRIPSFFVGEDDINYTFLQGITTYPFITKIIAPSITNVGFFSYKKIGYNSFQKLAYLHPNYFVPDKNLVSHLFQKKSYYVIRLVSLSAYHDGKNGGLTEDILDKLIELLCKYGNVYITSEKKLKPKYEKYQLPIKVSNIHHVLYFADLYIGDSQSMAVEAAMLGTPSIRFNSFVGKISVLEELQNKYELTYGIKTSEPGKLFKKIEELISMSNLKEEFRHRCKRMLSEKIDVSAFIIWLIGNYPESLKIMKNNPDYQFKFI